jgi:lactate dehydrogenase-like 2-hydroxyacid dehydrogenase
MPAAVSILVTRKLPASALAILRDAGDVDVAAAALDAPALRAHVPGRAALVCLLTDRIDEELLDAAGAGLRIVANVAVGVDNIDLGAARARGIVVTNTPDVLTNAVAEFTWGLILAVTRRLTEADRFIRRGDWTGWSPDLLNGTELAGKQLGILGAGRIGRAVGARASAFGMDVVFTRHGSVSEVDGHPALSMDEVLVTSDVVSVHTPLTPETRHLIDRRALARMKPSAYLINTARGLVVDEEALVTALESGAIAGAGLDVFEREPMVHPGLLRLENVVLAPHIGSSTHETRTAMAELAARNVVRVLRGQRPLTPVEK